MRLILLVSVGLNVFLLALTGGIILPRALEERAAPVAVAPHAAGPLFLPLREARDMPEAYRDQMRAALRKKMPELRALHEELYAARLKTADLMVPENYSREAVLAGIEDIHDIQGRQLVLMSAMLADFLDGLPEEDRAKVLAEIRSRQEQRLEYGRRELERRRHRLDRFRDGERPRREPASKPQE